VAEVEEECANSQETECSEEKKFTALVMEEKEEEETTIKDQKF
jgi:hypothetical protein